VSRGDAGDPRLARAAAGDAAQRPLRHPRGEPGPRRPVLRASYGQHLKEPAWEEFISDLCQRSQEFAELWARQEVASPSSRTKHFLHPDAGLLRLRSTSLAVADMPEARLVVYTPIDEETRQRLPLTRRQRQAQELAARGIGDCA
jgi:hypothetical protein